MPNYSICAQRSISAWTKDLRPDLIVAHQNREYIPPTQKKWAVAHSEGPSRSFFGRSPATWVRCVATTRVPKILHSSSVNKVPWRKWSLLHPDCIHSSFDNLIYLLCHTYCVDCSHIGNKNSANRLDSCTIISVDGLPSWHYLQINLLYLFVASAKHTLTLSSGQSPLQPCYLAQFNARYVKQIPAITRDKAINNRRWTIMNTSLSLAISEDWDQESDGRVASDKSRLRACSNWTRHEIVLHSVSRVRK